MQALAAMFYGNLENIVNRQRLGKLSFKQGLWGELKALFYIMMKGYLPLKWRYKTKHGEIDLIAKQKNTLVFIEVKTRPTLAKGYDSISAVQRNRIERAAQFFIQKHKKYQNCGSRFDAIIIIPRQWPIHLIHLW
jgi:putative endonuclease